MASDQRLPPPRHDVLRHTVSDLSDSDRASIIARLSRIEGQARGVRRMVEEGRDVLDVMTQIAAIRGATDAVGQDVLVAFALRCLHHPNEFASPEIAIEQAMQALVRSGR